MAIQTLNPATGEIIKKYKPATLGEIDRSLTRAEKAYQSWSKLQVGERLKFIKRLADHLEKHKHDHAKLITLEMGRVYSDSVSEIEKSVSICRYYINNAEKFLAELHVETEAAKSYIEYAPLGIILGIMPWNFPYSQAFRAIIPSLAAGNVIILKPASNVPQCALAIESLFAAAKFPPGVFKNLFIEGSEVGELIKDNRVAAVTLTGSEAAGAAVAKLAGEHLKKTVLELGGSDAFIVLEDADIDTAVAQAVKGRLMNAGQACNSPKRIILSHKIASEFKKKFVEKSAKLIVGDPLDPSTNVGPLARPDLIEVVERQLRDSVKKGAKILHGATKIKGPGFYYEVTVVDKVKKGMPLFDEEVFGPVVSFITVKSDAEAINAANDTHLGLSASVWTKDITRAHHFIDHLHVGLVFVNQVVRSDPRLPFGGVKKSGYGRELGEHGIKEFTNIKTVVIK